MMKVVPSVYHQYLDVFSKVKAEKLPPHRACDHHIELEGSLPPVGVIYSLSNQESDTLRAYISENVEKGFIRPSSSSTGAPVLFVKKKYGGLHLCVDYCKLNSVTRKNKYPVPPNNQLLNVFNGSSILSKIDFHGAYTLLRIKEGEEHLTAFRTKYGSFEYWVMPFGLTNAPASFQNHVNDIFQDLLDVYVLAYLDYIMVSSKSEEEHVTHVSTVLSRLRANNLFAKASKCLFHVSSVEYIGYAVSCEGLIMDQAKVEQILKGPPPINLKALQSFLGFSNFYRRFIKNYSNKISSLTSFLKKDSCFPLNEEALRTDASNYALGAVLSQGFDSGKHPIALNSRNPIPAELSYETHDKEILGIVWALKCWRAFLLSLSSPFEVLTDQSSVQYFRSSKVLTHRQAPWAELLSEFHLSITYHPGRLATLPDAKIISTGHRVVVPNDPTIQLSILQKHHYSPLDGHPGQEKTLKLFKQDFHWSGMTQFIKDYVSSCQQCSRNKNIHHKKFGFLKALPIPNGPWICLSMDFITQLPLSNSFDLIPVIVDRFSKMAVFIPTISSITSLDLAHLFIKNIFSKDGLPSRIVSDRGPLFVFSFWTNLCQKLKISRDLSNAYHPETDGQTERVNQILEQYLQMYFSYHQDD
ncbi:hypothetical protein O181_100073 [Austropuccinia psidii MF-1]|uniref:Integrase catalytic domain-containing protein n=1 Tax=Austropuccinia psidii MF-1 TaxID=1389203 RepID=A0A9Q3PFS1_9BASI|nr:hypothetical protein [Austropuccinia psidii MF-1]